MRFSRGRFRARPAGLKSGDRPSQKHQLPGGRLGDPASSKMPGEGRHERLSPERAAGRGCGGRGPERGAAKGFEGSKPPKGACILHFNGQLFGALPGKIPVRREEIFREMRKKLDYERILGYTSTGFESGG